ncbi:hypothetical protein DERP_010000 [Dermatophagoides pteronyssinus]|uniref:Uncharacterized protein n=1 Tax=Dermatophagoides pteronyssinus TaxID=6956 RepID=A0ABQ8J287_DERPT|nr:hypothetical protein DERP_010000 [Dermatophagoides pteronyssinus]
MNFTIQFIMKKYTNLINQISIFSLPGGRVVVVPSCVYVGATADGLLESLIRCRLYESIGESVLTIYSTSSVYGLWNAKLLVRNQTQSQFFARNLYITDITCPFRLRTVIKNDGLYVPSLFVFPVPRNDFICATAIRNIVNLSGFLANAEHVGTISDNSVIYAVILLRRRRSISL